MDRAPYLPFRDTPGYAIPSRSCAPNARILGGAGSDSTLRFGLSRLRLAQPASLWRFVTRSERTRFGSRSRVAKACVRGLHRDTKGGSDLAVRELVRDSVLADLLVDELSGNAAGTCEELGQRERHGSVDAGSSAAASSACRSTARSRTVGGRIRMVVLPRREASRERRESCEARSEPAVSLPRHSRPALDGVVSASASSRSSDQTGDTNRSDQGRCAARSEGFEPPTF